MNKLLTAILFLILSSSAIADSFVIEDIRVEGLQRISAGTVFNFIAVKVGDEITVKVIGIDNLGRVNLSRRAVFEKLPREPGDRMNDSQTADYPFRTQRESRSPRNK